MYVYIKLIYIFILLQFKTLSAKINVNFKLSRYFPMSFYKRN